MRIEIGRRAVNLYSQARDRVRQSRFYQVTVCSLKGIAPPPPPPPIEPATAIDPESVQRARFIKTISTGIVAGCETIGLGWQATKRLGKTEITGYKLAMAAGVVSAGSIMLWNFGIPLVTLRVPRAAIGLIAATAASIAAAKFNDKLPVHGIHRVTGGAARFLSRTAAPFIYAADGLYAGYEMHQANMNIANLIDSPNAALGVILATVGLVAWKIRNYIKSHDAAYLGKLMPGKKGYERGQKISAFMSNLGEYNYGLVRLILAGVATANIFGNIRGYGFIPLAVPLLGFASTAALRTRHDIYKTEKEARTLDHLKIYAPLWGLATGGVFALAALFSGAAAIPIAYFTLYGTFAVLFLNDAFDIFHTTNTNNEHIVKLDSSRGDLVGETEMKRIGKPVRVTMHNPYTSGTKDHSRGLVLSLLLNRKSNGVTYFCSSDAIAYENKDKMADFYTNDEYISWAQSLQQVFFNRIHLDIKPNQSPREKYALLERNLLALAEYAEGELPKVLQQKFRERPEWFEVYEDVREYQAGAFHQLDVLAREFRRDALALRRKINAGRMDEADFRKEWNNLLGRYDRNRVTVASLARKSIRGDGLERRKVENVAAFMLWRGITAYKLETKERPEDLETVQDVIGAEWSQVPNPNFDYSAPAGSFEASRYLWIPSKYLLTDLQKKEEHALSTSPYITGVGNQPTGAEGFKLRNDENGAAIKLRINNVDIDVPAAECYYVAADEPLTVPSVKKVNPRAGVTEAEVKALFSDPDPSKRYRLATFAGEPGAFGKRMTTHMNPDVFTLDSFDFIMMADRNDVEFVGNLLLPAIVLRERRDTHLQLIIRQEVGSGLAGWIRRELLGKNEFEFDDPHPDRLLDQRYGLQVVGGSMEMSYTTPDGKELLIPYQLARDTLHKGLDSGYDKDWASLKEAKITIGADGRIAGFSFVYGSKKGAADPPPLVIPPSRWPRYWRSLELPPGEHKLSVNNYTRVPNRKGDQAWILVHYADGSIGFARCADGKRPMLFNKDLEHYKKPPAQREGIL